MSGLLSLIVCSNFEREVRALASLPEFKDVDFVPLDVECNLVEGRWAGLAESVQALRRNGRPACLVGSFCLTQAAGCLGADGACPTAQKSQCAEWLADKDVLDHLLQQQALLVLPGWLEDWERSVDRLWASDRRKAQDFFRESAKKVILLDTGLRPKIGNALKEFAKFLRVPYETYFAGMGRLKAGLVETILSWRAGRERAELDGRLDAARRQIADYSRIGHLLGTMTRLRTEEEVREDIVEVFRDLLSPQAASYLPADRLAEEPPAVDTPRDRILSLNADYAWTDDRSGLLLKVANGRELLGLVELSGLPFPERREHDLDLALALAKTAALALTKAGLQKALDEERAKSRAAQAELSVSEGKARSFDGVPIGLYRTTPSGQILEANIALARMLGYQDLAALRGINAWDLHLNRGDREEWQSLLEASTFVETFETQLRRRDGTVIWVRDSSRAIKDKRGQVIYYEGSIEDITRKKQTDAASSWNLQMKTSLANVSGRLVRPTPIEEMSALVLEHARRLTSSRTCFVGYTDLETGRLVAAALTDDARDLLAVHPERAGALHAGSGIWEWVVAQKKAIVTNLPTLDPRYTGVPDWHFPVGQFLAVPALMDGALVGLIAVANSDKLYSEWDLEAVEQMAALYAIAVDRKRAEDKVREMSLTDELTRLNNRRGFFTLADQQLKIANRSKKEVFLLYADLDGLKSINDTFGHDVGDKALVETAERLRDAFRESDILARIGGDEFVVLVVDAGDARPGNLAERLQEKFDEGNARPGRRFTLSVSHGLVRYDPEDPCSVQDLITLADKLMYEDKVRKKKDAPGGRPSTRPQTVPA
ncbi:MAG TPA: diguanylate cyclase [Terriglobales bacterium]|nr:diguanylate cyclase [Terriglobales bacterium]